MKTKAKKLVTLILTALLVLSILPMNVFAAQRDVAPGSTASITINNAVEHDVLAAYKVIDIAYNDENNTLSYAWNSDFANYFDGTTSYNSTAYTVEQFAALTDDSAELKTLLAQLPNYIIAKNIASVGTKTVAADKTATFADLAMGEYFIRPTSTTSVYQLMLQKVEPTVASGKYVIDDVTFSAKHQGVSVTKTADKTSVTKNEKVTYTITVDIPTYATGATDRSFSVSDLLPDGLTIDTDSINVILKYLEFESTLPEGTYTLDKTATDDYTFKFSVDSTQYLDWAGLGGHQLIITYTATLKGDTTTEVNVEETNTVTFDYSNYPYVENSHAQKTATVDVKTFAIKIDKYVDGNPTNKLANAKFDLYRTLTAAEIAAGETGTPIPLTGLNGKQLESDLITDANGAATFAKYEANGDKYDYYLVETQAPSGYNLLADAVKVNFTDTDVATTAGIYTVQVPNKSGIQLPITGGTGTVIFTIIGIALMVGAVVLFVVSRKKAEESK